MLYDPKWEINTKPSLQGFIAWLETKDPRGRYSFLECEGRCLIGQYMEFLGIPWTGAPATPNGDWRSSSYKTVATAIFGAGPWTVHPSGPHTFGAALKRARDVLEAHKKWEGGHKVAMAHSLATMLRTVIGFGATILEDPDCQRLRGIMAGLRFRNAKRRGVVLTSEQADYIRDGASENFYYCIALAQAFQQDTALRQKDIIGEWVPVTDPAPSTVLSADGKEKWVRGITREEVSADLILTHKTSKRGQVLSFDLKVCPAVMEEWDFAPERGPLIVDPETDLPYEAWKFRRIWRRQADAVGVPKGVWNMDSRSGRITQAFADGANPDDIRKFAGHNNLSTTMGYSRGAADAIGRVLGATKKDANDNPQDDKPQD